MSHPETFKVTPEVRRLGLEAGVIVFRNVTIRESPPTLRASALLAAENLRQLFPTFGAIRQSQELSGFRNVYSALGPREKRQQSGCERLCELVWKRGDIPRVNTLVDIYNLVSIRKFLSLGAHDLDTLSLPVFLDLTTGSELFTPLNGIPQAIVPGEFGYVDAAGRMICRLDVLQGDFSKITPLTKSALVIVEGTVDHDRQTFVDTGAELIDLITRYCGGSADMAAWPF